MYLTADAYAILVLKNPCLTYRRTHFLLEGSVEALHALMSSLGSASSC